MATHQRIPLSLEKKDVVLVKPSEPTPSEVLSLSTIDNDPNLEILCQTIYVYQGNSISSNGNINGVKPNFTKQEDPATVIEEALSKVLVYYCPLAGKLKRKTDGKLQIDCTADGVPFLVATANCHLSSLRYLDGIDVETAQQLVFDYPSDDANVGYHPLVLQVTKFLCGGFTIGMGLSHSVCDGFGATQFFQALAELASGRSEPSVKPVWERERLVAKPTKEPLQFPVDKASAATSPYMPTTDLAHERFNVTSESIKRLKTSLTKEAGDLKESFTTLEVLAAYVWRSRLRALKLNPNGQTLSGIVVGIRRLLDPPLPEGYYGNAFVSSNVVLTGRELDEEPLVKTVKLIKESKKRSCDKDYIWRHIVILEKLTQAQMKIEAGTGAFMMLTDWRRLGLLEEVDFGWKGPVNMIPVPWKMFGYVDLCMFLPPCKVNPSMEGGVTVLVCLPRAAMSKFREEMNGLEVREDIAAAA